MGSVLTLENATSDESFCRLFKLLHRDAFTWDTFLTLPLPQGMSPLDSWRLSNTLSECFGISLVTSVKGSKLWYRPTCSLIEACYNTGERCHVHAPHHQALIADADQATVLELRVEEACAAVALTGLVDNYGQQVLRHLSGAPETSAVGLLIDNMIRIGSHLGRYYSVPFSEQLFESWQEELKEGIESHAFSHLVSQSQAHPVDGGAHPAMRVHRERIIAYANHEQGESEDSCLLRGILLGDLLTHCRPYELMSPLIASLATRLYYLKHNLSVLSIIPLSKQKLAWRHNALALEQLPFSFEAYESTFRHCLGDLTFHQVLSLCLINNGLDAVDVQLGTAGETDALIRELLSLESSINYRQRSILARALRNPKANFRIAYHQRKHNVAYATARRDLMELKDKGYLGIEHRGREFVFYPDSELEEFVLRS